jgi:hypothetical protein
MNELVKTVWIVVALCLVFCVGYISGFNLGITNSEILNNYVTESQDFIFICNPYSEHFRNCDNNLKFQNITGLYCNNTLICQNQLRKELKNE